MDEIIKNIKVLGMDISMNHGAIVELTSGELTNFWYYTDKPGSVKKSKRGYRVDPRIFKIKDKTLLGATRLNWFRDFLDTIVLSKSNPDYVGIEDYALKASQNAHYIGEIGGVAKILCFDHGIKFRMHDPTSVKMFVAHNGQSDKDAVQKAVCERWGKDFTCFDVDSRPTKKNPNPKQNKQTSEDLADAFGIAIMTWNEVLLRKGLIKLSDMHEKEIRVFNRTTKSYPVSLLGRDWVSNKVEVEVEND